MDQVLERHSVSEVKENLSGLIAEVETIFFCILL